MIRVKTLLHALRRMHGGVTWRCWGNPVDVLVETILSQNTSNANSQAGYKQLRRRFRTWAAVADAPVEEVAQAIRVSGLSNIKAPRIQSILRQIREANVARASRPRNRSIGHDPMIAKPVRTPDAGGTPTKHAGKMPAPRAISLEHLRDLPPREAWRRLMEFNGVGPKTAACVLLFSFGMPIFPVDTHIVRIAVRLGLVPPRTGAEKCQDLLEPRIPPGDRYEMHVLLITHGRKTCRAISPKCEWCDLIDECPDGQKSEIRSTKSETNPKRQIPNPKRRRHAP